MWLRGWEVRTQDASGNQTPSAARPLRLPGPHDSGVRSGCFLSSDGWVTYAYPKTRREVGWGRGQSAAAGATPPGQNSFTGSFIHSLFQGGWTRGVRRAWFPELVPPAACCVTSGPSLNFCFLHRIMWIIAHRVSHLQNGGDGTSRFWEEVSSHSVQRRRLGRVSADAEAGSALTPPVARWPAASSPRASALHRGGLCGAAPAWGTSPLLAGGRPRAVSIHPELPQPGAWGTSGSGPWNLLRWSWVIHLGEKKTSRVCRRP